MSATVLTGEGLRYHPDLIQGSEEWLAARCGLLTASEMKLIVTPSLKVSSNEKERAHLSELLGQRITGHVEPQYVSDDMLRGQQDEIDARILYGERYHTVEEVGFITNDRWGFKIGYSPDGLVGDDGLIECKSRAQKHQVDTLINHVPFDTIPVDYMIQIQTGMLVAERHWCDFISYCGGMPMAVIRVEADPKIQDAIVQAANEFEARLASKLAIYQNVLASKAVRLIPTERRIEQEMF